MKKILLSLVALLTAPAAIAETEVVTIVDHITSGTSNVINQPEELLKRLLPVEGVEEESKEEIARPVNGRMAGFRVQVFSDNNARTAKNEARSKQRIISSPFSAVSDVCHVHISLLATESGRFSHPAGCKRCGR